jgi:4-amino-4-deoxy-L-arabinose transferase-like glycosyltransferase
MRRSLRRLPAPLLVLLALCVVEALTWAVVVPPLSGPDEVSHVAYVQKIVEAHEIPWVRGESTDRRPPYSTQLSDAIIVGGITPVDANRSGRPLGTKVDEELWAAREAGHDRADRADGGFTSALKNPPAYYLYESLPYLAASSLGIFDQVFVMRMANVPLFLIAVIFVWLTAGELFARRRWLQVLATAAAALQPLLTHLAATVNPDVFLTATWSVALYLMVIALKRGLTARLIGALVVLAALSSLTHGRGVALVGPVLLTFGLALWKARRPGVRPAGRSAVALAAVGVLVGTALLVAIALKGAITASGVRQFGSYLWQFYLGRSDFLQPIGPDYGFREVSVDRFFGGYAQFEIGFSPAINDALWWGMIVIAALAVAGLLKRGPLGERWDVAVVLVSLPLAALALVHATAFSIVVGSTGDPVITGRYLLPLIPLYGIAIAMAVSWLPRRAGIAAGGALLATLVLIQLGAMGNTLERFYA